MSDLIALIISGVMLLIAYITGSIIEKNHFEDIKKRETGLIKLPTTSVGKKINLKNKKIKSMRLVSGSVVIGSDHFKDFVSGIRTIFGGNMVSYESLVDRARREAVLRMRESACDASIILNVKLETSILGDSSKRKQQPAQVAVIAYGTAITYGN